MAEMPRFGLKDALFLLLVLVVAAGVRIGYLFASLEDRAGPAPLVVESAQGPAGPAKDSKEQTWWLPPAPLETEKEQTAHIAPGYPWLVGWLSGLLDNPEHTIAALRWIQCGLGSLAAGLYFLFARRAFRSLAVGTLAGLFCALHPFWVINTTELNDGVVASFLLAVVLVTGTRASQEGDALGSLLFGLALAGLALVRAALLPFGLVACLWFLLRCRQVSRGWLCALLAFLGFANGLAPWAVRNFRTYHELVPVADSTYLHLWMGVNKEANGGPQNDQTLRKSLPPERLQELLAEKNQAKRYNLLGWDVLHRVAEDPATVLRGRLRAGLCFIFGRDWFQDGSLAQALAPEQLPWQLAENYPLILEATLLSMLALGFLGWRWAYGWRRESMPASLAVLWIPLSYILSHAGVLSGPRLPLDGVLLTYSAFALLCLLPGIGGRLLRGAADEANLKAYAP